MLNPKLESLVTITLLLTKLDQINTYRYFSNKEGSLFTPDPDFLSTVSLIYEYFTKISKGY